MPFHSMHIGSFQLSAYRFSDASRWSVLNSILKSPDKGFDTR